MLFSLPMLINSNIQNILLTFITIYSTAMRTLESEWSTSWNSYMPMSQLLSHLHGDTEDRQLKKVQFGSDRVTAGSFHVKSTHKKKTTYLFWLCWNLVSLLGPQNYFTPSFSCLGLSYQKKGFFSNVLHKELGPSSLHSLSFNLGLQWEQYVQTIM